MTINRKHIIFSLAALLVPTTCFANVVWPALYVADSYYSFWYVALFTVGIEAYLIAKLLEQNIKEAFIISIYANLFSATIGMFIIAFTMIIFGSFDLFSKIATIVLMWLLSALFETVIVRLIEKINFKRAFVCLLSGNILSYAVIAIDLFLLNGWARQY